MSTVIMEPKVDVVCLGAGYMSGVIAAELTKTYNKTVAAITKGPYWDYVNDYSTTKYDEWSVGLGRKYDSPLPLQSTTIRNQIGQFALPVRRYTMPIQYHALGHGVGGAAQHYGGTMGRQGPWGYTQLTSTINKYGAGYLPSNHDLEDWPLTYDQYDPYYAAWEQAHGLCGTDNGPLVPMTKATHYPLPPHPLTPVAQLAQTAMTALGYHPFPHVSALASQPYLNQYGVQINPCVYDGYCGGSCNYACETGAKANAAYRTIPAAVNTGLFTLATNSYIYRLDTDPSTHLVTAARYYDAHGNIHVQPINTPGAFFNGMWGYNMIRIMLLSGVGVPYNPTTVTGSVGRGLTNGYLPFKGSSVSGTLTNMGGNAYPAGNGSGGGVDIYDLMDDNFDHSPTALGSNPPFIGGSQISIGSYMGGGPGNISLAGGSSSASMGSAYKAKQQNKYLPTTIGLGATPLAHDIPVQSNYVDLDPHYTDIYGDPITRLTYDWTTNTYNGASYLINKCKAIFAQMGATNISTNTFAGPVHNDWWGHHLRGGCRIGKNVASSVYNDYNQHWIAPSGPTIGVNYFGAGEITNTCGDNVPSGTHVAGPQSYRAAEGIHLYLAGGGGNFLTP